MIIDFNEDTYIVLDLQEPISREIIRLRKQFDSFRASLPAEITVTGSSGNGTVSSSQNSEEFIEELNSIAKTIDPFSFSFSNPIQFPDTSIFVMSVKDKKPFEEIHKKINFSKIKFEKSLFPFFPHCTISSKSNISENEVKKIMNIKIMGNYQLNSLSVYQMGDLPLKKVYTVKLGNY